jgi:hypothetical protein
LERREELTQQKQSGPQAKSVKAIAPCFGDRARAFTGSTAMMAEQQRC